MKSSLIRTKFLDFFKSKQHAIVGSAPLVIKNDPSLLFTNAGMNQFKDIFLGEAKIVHSRIADTQKCLRVSGKHNDLEEVGIDTYHHTLFEMLGNWSFGDYYKKEAINWAWEFLIDVLKINKKNLYVTVFNGDKNEDIPADTEAFEFWKQIIDESQILNFSKKDNFWEMGETGPCGPCSEIHIDLRNESDKIKIPGSELVNTGHPEVIEIWNLVFIEYNRNLSGKLQMLQKKHVDTGMGFERLCMVIQNKKSNYDTDVFSGILKKIEQISGLKYGCDNKTDIAMRIAADHVRAVSFSIADGQLPSNVKAGYVIRRILRRAVRYSFTTLNIKEPFLHKLVNSVAVYYEVIFPEISKQKDLISKVIKEEEASFLRTLEVGLKKLEGVVLELKNNSQKKICGEIAFELYDTYGFPLDLTQLIARENGLVVDEKVFNIEMLHQKERARKATKISAGEWVIKEDGEVEFVGYDILETQSRILKYRKVETGGKSSFQLVFTPTPFYAESGGQVGDTGYIVSGSEKILVLDTKKENNLIIHSVEKLPENTELTITAVVDSLKQSLTANNHSATHLLHAALKMVLGSHVNQRGSLVHPDYLRFDFSHYQKVSDDELLKIENIVNEKIRKNLLLDEKRNIPFKDAVKNGAIALFGEKYGETVRMISFGKDFSRELCGGIHVQATSQIGWFKIITESAVASGIRRIEAVTSIKADEFINNKLLTLKKIQELLKSTVDIPEKIESLINENQKLQKEIQMHTLQKISNLKTELIEKKISINNINLIAEVIEVQDVDAIKGLSFEIKNQVNELFLVLGARINGKAHLSVMLSENLVKEKGLNANKIIKDIALEINGGGGGQPFYATAGGKNPDGLLKAIQKAKNYVS